jgi:hypothetical protein
MVRITLCLSGFISVVVAVNIGLHRNEVVWFHVPLGYLPGDVHILIVNPFKTWEAKHASDTFMKCMSNGDAKCILNKFPLLDKKAVVDDLSPPPVYWVLDGVWRDENGNLGFKYYDKTAGEEDLGGYVVINCARDFRGNWTIYDYMRVY